MICVHCGVDSTYPERADGRCKKCRRPFALDPRRGDPFTDMQLKRAVDAVSCGGSVAFLPDHVRHRLVKVSARRPRWWLAPLLMLGLVVPAFGLWHGGPGLALALFATLFVLAVSLGTRRSARGVAREGFDAAWRKYVTAHGAPKRLIQRLPRPSDPARHLAELEPDIADYSFDRAVICDRARNADVFLANDFHFENNCAVLTFDGYPEQAFEAVRRMLRRNPRLVVIAVHDASVEGALLAHRLRTDREWFREGPKVIDLGLTPRQARRFEGAWQRLAGAVHVPAAVALPESDRAWLGRWTLELSAIPPEQLLKRVFRAFQDAEGRAGDREAIGGDLTVEATASDGAADSFG